MDTNTWLLVLGAVAAVGSIGAVIVGGGAWFATHRSHDTARKALDLAEKSESRASTRHAVDWQDVAEEDDRGVRLRNGGPDTAHEVTVTASW